MVEFPLLESVTSLRAWMMSRMETQRVQEFPKATNEKGEMPTPLEKKIKSS